MSLAVRGGAVVLRRYARAVLRPPTRRVAFLPNVLGNFNVLVDKRQAARLRAGLRVGAFGEPRCRRHLPRDVCHRPPAAQRSRAAIRPAEVLVAVAPLLPAELEWVARPCDQRSIGARPSKRRHHYQNCATAQLSAYIIEAAMIATDQEETL